MGEIPKPQELGGAGLVQPPRAPPSSNPRPHWWRPAARPVLFFEYIRRWKWQLLLEASLTGGWFIRPSTLPSLHPSPPSLWPRCSLSLPPPFNLGPLFTWPGSAVPGFCGSPGSSASLPRAPPRWRRLSRTPLRRVRLSVRPACAVAPSVRATSRASGWELMASWRPRSAWPLPRLSPPSPKLCTTSLGSAGRAPQRSRVWGERSMLGCWYQASWGTRHGTRIREASGEAFQVESASGTRTRVGRPGLCCSHSPGNLLAGTRLKTLFSPLLPQCASAQIATILPQAGDHGPGGELEGGRAVHFS